MRERNKNILAIIFFIGIIAFAIHLVTAGNSFLNQRESLKAENQQEFLEDGERELSELINWERGAALGDENAPVRMVNFSTYYCPFCVQFKEDIFPTLKEEYIENGDLLYLYRDLGNPSDPIFQAAYCAQEEDLFWDYQDGLYEMDNIQSIEDDNLLSIAERLEIDMDNFKDCLQEERYKDMVKLGSYEAGKLGVGGTPYILIENVDLTGLRSLEDYKQVIEIKLNENN